MLVPAPATSHPPAPTAAEIRRAVRTAERSPRLWATINQCSGTTIGIRGQMPALPFATHLDLSVQPESWSPTLHRYVPLGRPDPLGGRLLSGDRTLQAGVTLQDPTPTNLIGTVTFRWVRGGRTLGRASRATSLGHPDDHGTPARTSLAQCSTG